VLHKLSQIEQGLCHLWNILTIQSILYTGYNLLPLILCQSVPTGYKRSIEKLPADMTNGYGMYITGKGLNRVLSERRIKIIL